MSTAVREQGVLLHVLTTTARRNCQWAVCVLVLLCCCQMDCSIADPLFQVKPSCRPRCNRLLSPNHACPFAQSQPVRPCKCIAHSHPAHLVCERDMQRRLSRVDVCLRTRQATVQPSHRLAASGTPVPEAKRSFHHMLFALSCSDHASICMVPLAVCADVV